jgi:hypothetical protein
VWGVERRRPFWDNGRSFIEVIEDNSMLRQLDCQVDLWLFFFSNVRVKKRPDETDVIITSSLSLSLSLSLSPEYT